MHNSVTHLEGDNSHDIVFTHPTGQITTTQTLDGTTPQVNVTADVNGLTPSTEYHYRLVVADVTGAWTTGDDPTFTTPAG
jgi:phosphodiesterase/alkaline phosphatase D-like protein